LGKRYWRGEKKAQTDKPLWGKKGKELMNESCHRSMGGERRKSWGVWEGKGRREWPNGEGGRSEWNEKRKHRIKAMFFEGLREMQGGKTCPDRRRQ